MLLQNKHYHGEEAIAFESWLAQKRNERRLTRSNHRTSAVVTIPVVVHIIHNGESLGNGANIPTEQVLSQIEILNADYRRANADASETFPEFVSEAADTEINFQLAVRDPEGLPTTGIIRLEGNRPSYSLTSGQLLSDLSYWPAEDYLNIWVTNLGAGLLGYAQFPVSNLEGLDVDRVSNAKTDGAVIDYEYFGKGFNADDFSQGRTATHEIGHYLGLRHIWGDGGCGATDYCDDTPDQLRSTSGCPPSPEESCGTLDMAQNFMDYTDDICMNLFTNCQRERMHVILENSPRRVSLSNSPALTPVVTVGNDIGVRQWAGLYNSSCSEVLSPVIELRNHGSNLVTTLETSLSINGELVETVSLSDLNLPFRDLQLVQFSDVSISQSGTYDLEVNITEINGVPDANPSNNQLTQTIHHTMPATGDFMTDFESSNEWVLQENSRLSLAVAPNQSLDNNAVVFNFFDSDEPLGTRSTLQSPVIKINPSSSPRLEFKYAYNHPPDNLAEAFFVMVSTDCGLTYHPSNTVFQSYGSGLNSSSQPSDEFFTPSGSSEWQSANVDLSRFTEEGFIRLAFIGQNGQGNNLYLDDILISVGPNSDYDVSIDAIQDFPKVTCEPEITPTVTVINNGNESIDSFELQYSINGVSSGSQLFEGFRIDPFERRTVVLSVEGLAPGTNSALDISVSIVGQEDQVPDNNQATMHTYFDQTDLSFPYRLDPEQPDWFEYQASGKTGWRFGTEHVSIQFDQSTDSGEEFWLVSPRIYPSELQGLSMAYEVAYPNLSGRNDRLIVAIDWNCDGIFDQEEVNRSGEQLATSEYIAGWEPVESDDWRREIIDLSDYLIFDEIRIAVKAVSQQGTALYLRNLEVYPSSRPSINITNEWQVYPNPATELILVRFNLPQIEPATIRLIDMKGQVLFDKTFENTLNQTYELLTANENNGMYLMQVVTPSFNSTERVIIWR